MGDGGKGRMGERKMYIILKNKQDGFTALFIFN